MMPDIECILFKMDVWPHFTIKLVKRHYGILSTVTQIVLNLDMDIKAASMCP